MATPRFNHVNIPARDPEGLARWYGELLGAAVKGSSVRGEGWLVNFTADGPLNAPESFHTGFRVETKDAARAYLSREGAKLEFDQQDFFAVRLNDPEGNLLEIYWATG